ncbi:hypothetical protein F9L16_21875 [Agarivorans sp. B2Z047]|uniref:hypothetical protein n=1 Tax=Agarivorans sp. B2Z047 TaxID=2652721 RepID=UPI00128CF17E|nr:hypothetical protein [Agarivorans sp. B2Z047]MPW31628.1 hypothetical protein [Agarivorans sp. B2Z047]UQN42412.1 hypothetical protein LQZ07_21955 [Agarivorans sp. B2Z047]
MNKELNVKPIVSDKPYSVSIEMRPLWRICLILVCVSVVSGDKKYLNSKKVNILVWMLIRKNRWQEYEDYLLSRSENVPLVSIDTATFKAIELSIAKGFLSLENDRIFVTESGEELFSLLVENNIMDEEVCFLKKLGKKLSDNKVKGLTGGIK